MNHSKFYKYNVLMDNFPSNVLPYAFIGKISKSMNHSKFYKYNNDFHVFFRFSILPWNVLPDTFEYQKYCYA